MTKLLRYSAASVVAVAVGQATLVALIEVGEIEPWVANVIAATVGAVPNYVINRYWTWGVRGRSSLRREVLPFWVLSIAGLAVSTVFVAAADAVWGTTLAASLASIAGFGAVWVVKFAVLEYAMWRPAPSTSEADA